MNDSIDNILTEKTVKFDEIIKEQAIKYLDLTNQIPSLVHPNYTFVHENENDEDFQIRKLAHDRMLTQQELDKKSGNKKRPLSYCDVKLDILRILEIAPQLGNLVLNDNDCGRWIFQSIIQEFFQNKSRKDFEVVIDIKFTTWPALNIFNYKQSFTSAENGNGPVRNKSPIRILGILTSLSRSTEFIRSFSYRCSDNGCPNSKVAHYRHIRIPGFETESGLPLNDARSGCQLCCNSFIEEPSRRGIWEFLVGIIVPPEAYETSVDGNYHHLNDQNIRLQGIPVFFGKQWFSDLAHGQRYEIIAECLYSTENNTTNTKESSIEESIPHPPYISGSGNVYECVGLKPSLHPLKQWSQQLHNVEEFAISEDLYNMYLGCIRSSPWSFILSLAYEFGSKISPRESFFKLKIAILLSLVSQTSQEEDWPLPLMVIARDTYFPAKLLQYGMSLAERSTTHSADINELIPSPSPCAVNCGLVSSAHKCGTLYTDAGSILLSRGGVCYLGELQRYKKQTLQLIRAILDEGRVQTNESRAQKKKCCFSSQPLTASLWSVCTLPDGKGTQNFDKQKQLFLINQKHLVDVFGQVLLVENDNAGQMNKLEETVADFILENAINPNVNQECQEVCKPNSNEFSTGILPEKYELSKNTDNVGPKHLCFLELKEHLCQAREIETQIDSDAIEMIKKYFVASRRSKWSMDNSIVAGSQNASFTSVASSKGGHVPQCALKTITTMAESHAKLCLRRTVDIDDAVFAIYLYEENIQALYGNGSIDWSISPLIIAHEPHLREGCSDSDLIECFRSAKLSIIRFIESYTGDLSFTQVEE